VSSDAEDITSCMQLSYQMSGQQLQTTTTHGDELAQSFDATSKEVIPGPAGNY